MQRNYQALSVVLIICACILQCYLAMRCNKTPHGKRSHPGDRFSIEVSDATEYYVPDECYRVNLQANRDATFLSFTVIVESESKEKNPNVGDVYPMGETVNSDCNHAVQQKTLTPKKQAEFKWIAPTSGSGCVAFRAMVVENNDVWYMDDGGLTKRLCEKPTIRRDSEEACCSCTEAKYEMAFEGSWSRLTHPKNFPVRTHSAFFGVIIGASHDANYLFWKEGELASPGVKDLAERGDTYLLETELKNNSQNIRTIIKAPSLQNNDFKEKSYSVFRVDPEKHMVSIVSKIHPSPDWIVGVSGVDLCDCEKNEWVKDTVIELFPWDVGTDSGISYESEDEPTIPPLPIQRIRNYSPSNTTAPFFDAMCKKMNPLASLYLTRKRIYERNCEVTPDTPQKPHHQHKDVCRKRKDPGDCSGSEEKWYYNKVNKKCETFTYSGCGGNENRFNSKKECKQTCVKRHHKTVPVVTADEEMEENMITEDEEGRENEVENVEEEEAEGGEEEEENNNERDEEVNEDDDVDNGDFENGRDEDEENGEEDDYDSESQFPLPPGNQKISTNIVTGVRGRIVDCKVSNWSPWSPCSATCGRAWKKRTRRIVHHNENGGRACPRKLLMKRKCRNLGKCREYNNNYNNENRYSNDYEYK